MRDAYGLMFAPGDRYHQSSGQNGIGQQAKDQPPISQGRCPGNDRLIISLMILSSFLTDRDHYEMAG